MSISLVTQDVQNIASATAAQTINDNFAAVIAAVDKALNKEGGVGNAMEADLDLDSNDILNVNNLGVTTGTIATLYATTIFSNGINLTTKINEAIASAAAAAISETNAESHKDDAEAAKIAAQAAAANQPPSGGTTGQVLGKASNTDYDYSWLTLAGTGTVTSVGLSGTNGITITGATPITTSGSWTISVNAATLRSHLNVADGADVSPVASVNGNTGTVVLDPDDLDDTSTTNKFASTANVQAAGALMDSEVTNLADVKAFDPSDYATAAHTHDHTEISDYDTELAGKTNTTAFTPTADYHPATKKYVDDEITGAGGYNDEAAQDAIGTILVDSSEIDFTYNDSTPSITASIVAASIDESKLDTSVNASLDLADSALQPADIASGTITARADDIDLSGGTDGDVLTVQADGSLAVETPASVPSAFSDLTDVTITSIASGEIPKWNGSAWVNNTLAEAGISATSHNHTLDSLSNVTITSIASGELLQWNGSAYVNQTIAELGLIETSDKATETNIREATADKYITADILEDVQEFDTLTYAATYTHDLHANRNGSITLTGDIDFANPSNMTSGQSFTIRAIQDATGGRNMTFGSYFKFTYGTVDDFGTAANDVNTIICKVTSATTIECAIRPEVD